MSAETDSHGRLYLSTELREKYGERFHVVEYEDRIELVPIEENPLAAIREAAGDTFEDIPIDDLREQATAQAKMAVERNDERSADGEDHTTQ
jgi:hypothetical protein